MLGATTNIAWSFWEHASSALEWQSLGVTLDQTWESGAKHNVGLSRGESEYNALLRSSAHALGIKAMLNDLHCGMKCEIHMRCDSSTARDMLARQGLGETRHVDVCFLWLLQAVQEGRLKVLRVPSSVNVSDTFTISLSHADADRC